MLSVYGGGQECHGQLTGLLILCGCVFSCAGVMVLCWCDGAVLVWWCCAGVMVLCWCDGAVLVWWCCAGVMVL